MIFGKTYERQRQEESEKAKKRIFGIKKFAWYPVQLRSGNFIFCDWYYEYSSGSLDSFSNYYEVDSSDKRRYASPSDDYVCYYKR